MAKAFESIIMRVGEWKGLIVTPETLLEMKKGFDLNGEMPLDLEFMASMLSGKMGTLHKVYIQDDKLYGTFSVPDCVVDVIDNEPKFAVSISRKSPSIKSASVVKNHYTFVE